MEGKATEKVISDIRDDHDRGKVHIRACVRTTARRLDRKRTCTRGVSRAGRVQGVCVCIHTSADDERDECEILTIHTCDE